MTSAAPSEKRRTCAVQWLRAHELALAAVLDDPIDKLELHVIALLKLLEDHYLALDVRVHSILHLLLHNEGLALNRVQTTLAPTPTHIFEQVGGTAAEAEMLVLKTRWTMEDAETAEEAYPDSMVTTEDGASGHAARGPHTEIEPESLGLRLQAGT